MSPGYQAVQSTHAVADFAAENPIEFKKWKEESNYIICLGIDDEFRLLELEKQLSQLTKTVLFFEPDINQYTSFALVATPDIQKRLSKLPLLLKNKTHENGIVR